MSRAFVKEDDFEPDPEFDLPDPESDYFDEAAALALIHGANLGDTRAAEQATGYRWGEKKLVPHVRKLLEQAEAEDGIRQRQLARRYLRAAGVKL